ncbi:hypothetical protein HDK77DRAFT_77952 [Phyllosticta capitalensis]|uniref:Uncharacterized protein n=1 Tax=Phyllosticta capitalensis TaxID=121624 RepID=A0ABR1YCN0_9PEZI
MKPKRGLHAHHLVQSQERGRRSGSSLALASSELCQSSTGCWHFGSTRFEVAVQSWCAKEKELRIAAKVDGHLPLRQRSQRGGASADEKLGQHKSSIQKPTQTFGGKTNCVRKGFIIFLAEVLQNGIVGEGIENVDVDDLVWNALLIHVTVDSGKHHVGNLAGSLQAQGDMHLDLFAVLDLDDLAAFRSLVVPVGAPAVYTCSKRIAQLWLLSCF